MLNQPDGEVNCRYLTVACGGLKCQCAMYLLGIDNCRSQYTMWFSGERTPEVLIGYSRELSLTGLPNNPKRNHMFVQLGGKK